MFGRTPQGRTAGPATAHGPDTSNHSTWVRVLQRWAGAGMGLHFTPRIGQEVLIDFIEGDIDRPLVIGALYNGRGEGGTAPTPGGQATASDTRADTSTDTPVFAQSTDHTPSAQGNLSAGNAPPWHGASAAATTAQGQANAAALSGWKRKEFGAGSGNGSGSGFNQLVFDDSHQQLRVQLATQPSEPAGTCRLHDSTPLIRRIESKPESSRARIGAFEPAGLKRRRLLKYAGCKNSGNYQSTGA